MSLSLELAQTVAVGPFNPYIIHPEWLVKQAILPDDEMNVRLAAVGEGAAFKFHDMDWEVDTRHLSVSARQADRDCGELTARVLELLPHTPVAGVGHNFHFAGSREDWATSPMPKLGDKGFGDFDPVGRLEQSRWTGVFLQAGVRIEVTVVFAGEAAAVLFNHHRNTNPKDFREAVAAARLFRHDQQVSRDLLLTLVAQEVRDV